MTKFREHVVLQLCSGTTVGQRVAPGETNTIFSHLQGETYFRSQKFNIYNTDYQLEKSKNQKKFRTGFGLHVFSMVQN